MLRAAIGVAVLALVVRVLYFLIVGGGGLVESDSHDYLGLAAQLSHGHYRPITSLASGGFPVDLNRPPGYPAFLVAANLGGTVSLDRSAIVQIVLGALFAGGLTLLIGRWAGRRAGVLAGVLLAVDWITVINTPLILSDVIFAMLYAGGVALVVQTLRSRSVVWPVAAGVVLGISALFKPIGLVGGLVLVLALVLAPRRNWRVALAVVAMAAVTVPWAVRNDSRYGVFTISTIGTVNVYAYTAQGALHDGYLYGGGGATNANVANQTTAPLRRLGLSTSKLYSRMNSDSLSAVEHHLPKAIVQELWGTVHVMFGTGRETLIGSTHDPTLPSPVASWIPLVQTLVMWALVLAGVVTAWRRRVLDRAAIIVLVVAMALVLLAAGGPAGYGRYRLPAAPIEAVLAGVALAGFAELPLHVRSRTRTGARLRLARG